MNTNAQASSASVPTKITAVSRAPGLLDIFYRGTDGGVHTNGYNGTQWSGDIGIAGVGYGNVAAVPRGVNRLDIFQMNSSNRLTTASWLGPGNPWTAESFLGTDSFLSNITAVSWDSSSRIDVFGGLEGGGLATESWDGKNWYENKLESELFYTGPSVVSSAPGLLDVFVQGTGQTLLQASWNGSAWSSFIQRGTEQFLGTPAVVSPAPNRLDVFVRGTDDRLYWKHWDGSQWGNYTRLGDETFVGNPSVVSRSANLLDVFVQGPDGKLYTKAYDGTQWWDHYEALGTSSTFIGDPSPVSWGPQRIDVFVEGTDGGVYKIAWAGSNWETAYTSLGGSVLTDNTP